MFKKIGIILSLIIVQFFTIMTVRVNANDYTLNDLINNGKLYDKKEVRVEGEAIGEALSRDKYSWININDKTNALGVYMTNEDSIKVKMYGGYEKIGDTIEVVGTFNRACKEHGGDMDIHAKEVNVIEEGRLLKNGVSKEKIFLTILLAMTALVLAYISYKKLK